MEHIKIFPIAIAGTIVELFRCLDIFTGKETFTRESKESEIQPNSRPMADVLLCINFIFYLIAFRFHKTERKASEVSLDLFIPL